MAMSCGAFAGAAEERKEGRSPLEAVGSQHGNGGMVQCSEEEEEKARIKGVGLQEISQEQCVTLEDGGGSQRRGLAYDQDGNSISRTAGQVPCGQIRPLLAGLRA